jgi:Tfp pilus assembly protein PilO
MNVVREYQRPLIIGGVALVALLLIWAVLVAPQNSKLANLQNQETQLQAKQATLEAKLATLRSEKQNLTNSCADLQKIATQIPTVQNPTDIDAEESSFESQFNGLAASSGVSLAQFSGFTPATTTGASAASAGATGAGGAAGAAGVTAVPTTLTVSGNYGQMMAFINGLDTFPRLFVIQKFVLAYGQAPSSGSSSVASGSSSSSASAGQVAASEGAPALWTGGSSTPATAGPYNLGITGSIYYTSTPNALDACTKAAATLK